MADIDEKYLQSKKDRTRREFLEWFKMRLETDNTTNDARLQVAYSEAGTFRRVVIDGFTGAELKFLVSSADEHITRREKS